MQAFSVVEDQSFIDLTLMGLSNKKVMTRPTLMKMMKEKYGQMVANIKEEFEKVQVICITTDIWSCATRSFIGKDFYLNKHPLNR